MTKLLIGVFLAFFPTTWTNTPCQKGYIKIRYTGDPNKFFPRVVFYLPDSYDTVYKSFYAKMQVTLAQYQNIKTAIDSAKTIKKSPPDSLEYPFLVTVTECNKADTLSISDKRTIGFLFKRIKGIITDTLENTMYVEAALDELAGRLDIKYPTTKKLH